MILKYEVYAYELGLLPNQFWRMTPREFIVYAQARYKFIKDEDLRAWQKNAVLCSTIANFVPMRNKKGKTYKPDDFMPKQPQTQDDMLKTVERLNKFFGGDDKRKRGD